MQLQARWCNSLYMTSLYGGHLMLIVPAAIHLMHLNQLPQGVQRDEP